MATSKKTSIRIPQDYDVNFEAFVKDIGYTMNDLYHIGKMDDNACMLMTHKSIEYTIDSIIEQLKCKSKFKRKSGKNKNKIGYTKWEYKSYECYLAIYLNDASLSYTIRCNTTNSSNEIMRNVYFYYGKMTFSVEELVIGIIKDFTGLIREAHSLLYAFEYYGEDNIPRRTHKDGSAFCSRREDYLYKPKHFYDGYIDYDHRDYVMFPWEEWAEELYSG
jgi:hypothetical protein